MQQFDLPQLCFKAWQIVVYQIPNEMSAKFAIRRSSAGDYNIATKNRNSNFVLKTPAYESCAPCNEHTFFLKQTRTTITFLV